MTAEEKREQLLKRILPALVITVIYFVFISGIMSEKMDKARQDYDDIVRRGVSPDDIDLLQVQQGKVQAEISELKQEHEKFRQKLKGMAGFLTNSTPDNETNQILSHIIVDNHLLIAEQKRAPFASDQLPPSLQEIKHWLKDSIDSEADSITVEQLMLTGSYRDMYHALNAIAQDKLQALPVILTMKEHLDENQTPDGDLEWELILWM